MQTPMERGPAPGYVGRPDLPVFTATLQVRFIERKCADGCMGVQPNRQAVRLAANDNTGLRGDVGRLESLLTSFACLFLSLLLLTLIPSFVSVYLRLRLSTCVCMRHPSLSIWQPRLSIFLSISGSTTHPLSIYLFPDPQRTLCLSGSCRWRVRCAAAAAWPLYSTRLAGAGTTAATATGRATSSSASERSDPRLSVCLRAFQAQRRVCTCLPSALPCIVVFPWMSILLKFRRASSAGTCLLIVGTRPRPGTRPGSLGKPDRRTDGRTDGRKGAPSLRKPEYLTPVGCPCAAPTPQLLQGCICPQFRSSVDFHIDWAS
jgi:hypothetical protein